MKRLGWIKITLIILMVIGFLARVYQIGSVSNQFHLTRQFSTAQMVRGDYFATADVPEWRRAVALANQPPSLEPPVIQTVALLGYKLVGSEQLWIPRTFSALAWVIGAFFLFLAAKKIMREEAALVTVAFYLFTPFGLAASRSFQANPTMIALSIISYFTILHYFEQPSKQRLFWAIIAAAITNLVMIYTVFTIFLLFGWLSLQRHGLRRVLLEPDTWLFLFLSLLPSGIYYFNGLFIAGYLRSQTGALFNPSLWLTPIYWINWVALIGEVVGFIALILSIQALLTARKPLQSATLRSLWLGYLLYGFVISWPIMSHSYYSMPLIPIVALSLGSVADFIFVRLQAPRQRQWIPGLTLAGIAAFSIFGLAIYLPTTTVTSELAHEVEIAQEVGDKVQHSTHTIFLAKDYGSFLKFYGEIAGLSWPGTWDFNAERVAGKPTISLVQRLNAMNTENSPQYFIITDFDELSLQDDLEQYLSSHFTVVERNDDFIIYDMKMPQVASS